MRIAIVAGPHMAVPPTQYGGSEQVIYTLINGLQKAGHTPIVLGTGDSNVNCELIPITKKAIGYPLTSSGLAEHAKLEAAANELIAKRLRELLPRIDIIHSHNFDLLPFANFPNITTLHGRFTFDLLPYFKKRTNLNYISISNNQRQAFSGLNYIDTIYNGEDASLFHVVKKPKNYVCFLGRFDWDKSPHMAIELALTIGVPIKLAGKIDYKGETYFAEKIKPYLSNPLVEYVGELGFKDKTELLGNALCNLHPANFREPFGLTVLEAAYCGTPTLATNRGAIPEIIEHGRTGLVVEDFVEGAQKIEKCFVMDREYIAACAMQKFNSEKMTQHYIAAYQKVITAATHKG